MHRNDATFRAMVSRLETGEITRQQAAQEYQVNYGTLCVWLSRSNLNKSTRMKDKPLYGEAAKKAQMDPDKAGRTAEAVAKVLDGTYASCLAASKDYPDISLSTLTARVRKSRTLQSA